MKTILKIFVVLFSLSFATTKAQNIDQFFSDSDAFFKQYVSGGRVDYDAINGNQDDLNAILASAKEIKVSSSNANTYKAFWINAYNLSVIKGIINNYPIKSPLDKKGFFDKKTYDIGGTSITLNDIENKKLRAVFNDARFHFVLVCGAKGCPPIIAKAYTPSNVESLLEGQTIKALNNASFTKVSGKKVAFSEIFKWYKEDFVQDGQTEIDFLNKYLKTPVPANAKVTYYTYDWRLNSK